MVKRTYKVIGCLLLLAWSLLAPLAFASPLGDRPTLHVLTWPDYVDPEVVTAFERRYRVRVAFDYIMSDDERDQLLAGNDGRGYDVMLVNAINLSPYARRRWIAPIDGSRLSNFHHIDSRWLPPASKPLYGIPYFWGTLGIAYRKDLVPRGFPSWHDFFSPAPELAGKINAVRSSRELFASALKALGVSVNSDDAQAINQAEQLLLSQKEVINDYGSTLLSEDSALVDGRIWALQMYSGNALVLAEHHPEIAYTIPWEGCVLWTDYLTVARSSTQKELALALINFLNNPQIAARNAQYNYFASPNIGAKAHLPPEYLNDPVVYPADELIKRCEYLKPLPARAKKRLNKLALRLFN